MPARNSKDRLKFAQQLNALPSQQFDQLLFALDPPRGVVSPSLAPQGNRVAELLNWAEGTGGSGLDRIQQALDDLIAGASTPPKVTDNVAERPSGTAESTPTCEFFPVKRDENDAAERFFTWVIEGDYIPDDILDRLKIESFEGNYLPFYLFTVDWSNRWTAEVGNAHEVRYTDYKTGYDNHGNPYDTSVTKTKTEIGWSRVSGHDHGQEKIVVMANSRYDFLESHIREKCRELWRRNELQKLSDVPASSIDIQQPDLAESFAYEKSVEETLEHKARKKAEGTLSGKSWRNYIPKVKKEDSSVRLVFLPIWECIYRFTSQSCRVDANRSPGQPCRYYAAGWDSTTPPIHYPDPACKPEDATRKQSVKLVYKPRNKLALRYMLPVTGLFIAALGLFAVSKTSYESYEVLSTLGYGLSGAVTLGGIIIGVIGLVKISSEKSTADRKRSAIVKRSEDVRRRAMETYLDLWKTRRRGN